VGGGVGSANVMVAARAPLQPSGEQTGFAYNLAAGVAHPFNDRLTGELAYKYVAAPSIKIGPEPDRIDGNYSTSVVSVGLRYKIGS
jgi:opacity protein-like surface antigen